MLQFDFDSKALITKKGLLSKTFCMQFPVFLESFFLDTGFFSGESTQVKQPFSAYFPFFVHLNAVDKR